MIEKVKMEDRGKTFCFEDLIIAMAKKQDEIIDKVNELDIKLHTVKFFTPTQDKAVKELLKLLETDNSVKELLNEKSNH